jgi:DNA-binding NtrC family response regulator
MNAMQMTAANVERRPERPLILILEDDNSLAIALEVLLADWGFRPFLAASPAAAARALGMRMRDVDAIIADYHLDDGFTGIKGAKELSRAVGREVPTIVTTAHAMMAEHANAYPVLAKPFDPQILRRWLIDHVGGVEGEGG